MDHLLVMRLRCHGGLSPNSQHNSEGLLIAPSPEQKAFQAQGLIYRGNKALLA